MGSASHGGAGYRGGMSQSAPQAPQRPQGLGVLFALFGLLVAVLAASVVWIMVNSDTGEERPWSKPAINGTEITVQYQAACVDAQGLAVEETSSTVTLTLSVDEASDCEQEPTTQYETAVLKGSFNDRRLIDGACLSEEFTGTEACSIESHRPISNTGLKKKVADPETVTEPSSSPSAS